MRRAILFTTLLCALPRLSIAESNTTINIASLSVDGLEARQINCGLKGSALLGPMMVVGTLAKQKEALDRCAPAGQTFTVWLRWNPGSKAKAGVTSGGSLTEQACVTQALLQVTPAMEGHCTMVLVVGAKAKAAPSGGEGGKPSRRGARPSFSSP